MSSVVLLDSTTPTARKPHRCELCGRRIDVGEKYTANKNVFDGRVYTFKECAHCKALQRVTSFGDHLDECSRYGDGFCGDDAMQWEPETRREMALNSQLRRGWRNYAGPAALNEKYGFRERPSDDSPLCPIPTEVTA